MKKIAKTLLTLFVALSMIMGTFSVVSAEGSREYLTIDLASNGANAKLFATASEADAMKDAMNNLATNLDYPDAQTIKDYPSRNLAIDSGRGARIGFALSKEQFDSRKADDGFFYDSTGEVPFNVSTSGEKNGIALGRSNANETAVTVNTNGKKLSKIYVMDYFYDSAAALSVNVKYKDSEVKESISYILKNATYNDGDTATGLWTDKFAADYEFQITDSGSKSDDNYILAAATYRSVNRYVHIGEVDVDPLRDVEYISFKMSDNYRPGAIVALTGVVADEAEVTAAAVEKLESFGTITVDNCFEAKKIADLININLVEETQKETIQNIINEINALASAYTDAISEYDFIDIDSFKNIKAPAVGDAVVQGVGHTETAYDTLNKKAIESNRILGYTFSNAKVPYDIKLNSDGNYAAKVWGNSQMVSNGGSITIPVNGIYNKLNVALISSATYSGSRTDIKFEVIYEDGTTESYDPSRLNLFGIAREDTKASLVAGSDYIVYNGDEANKDSTYAYLTGSSTYSVHTAYKNTYIQSAEITTKITSSIKELRVVCTPSWLSVSVLGVSAHKLSAEDRLTNLSEDVTKTNAAQYKTTLSDLSGSYNSLSDELKQKYNRLLNKTNYYYSEYEPIDISAYANGVVFANSGIAKSEVVAGKYVSNPLNRAAFESIKSNSLIYVNDNTPFNVNTSKSPVIGKNGNDSVEISVSGKNYDSVSVLMYDSGNTSKDEFEVRAVYADGTYTLDSNITPGIFTWDSGYYETGNAKNTLDYSSYLYVDSNTAPTLRVQNDGDTYTEFKTAFYFPVITIDTDENKTLEKIVITNISNYVDKAILGVTGAVVESPADKFERITSGTVKNFSYDELEEAVTKIKTFKDNGVISEGEYNLVRQKAIDIADGVFSVESVSYNNGNVTALVRTHIPEDKAYTVIGAVYSGDELVRIKVLSQGVSNGFETINANGNLQVSDGETLKIFVWDSLATLKPLAACK